MNGTVSDIYNDTNFLGDATMAAGSNLITILTWDEAGTNDTYRSVFMPPAKPQVFLFDQNGNLTNDGYQAYTWTDENRLAAVETAVPAVNEGMERRKSAFVYDGQGRRVRKFDCGKMGTDEKK